MKLKFILTYVVMIMGMVLLFTSCEKDPEIPHEEELITTLTLHLAPEGGGESVVFTFRDLDGDGGNDPVMTTGLLASGTVYLSTVEILNESVSPALDITHEIEEEAEEHQLFFEITGADATFQYDDLDGNGRPVGLHGEISTHAAGAGTISITLRHQPDKMAAGVSGGLIANAGGETDIEVTFPLVVQ